MRFITNLPKISKFDPKVCDLASVILSGVTILFVCIAIIAATVAVVRSLFRGDEEEAQGIE